MDFATLVSITLSCFTYELGNIACSDITYDTCFVLEDHQVTETILEKISRSILGTSARVSPIS